ncbi:signal peptidase II [Thermovibrio ammonificans]
MKRLLFLTVALLTFLADRVTKLLALKFLSGKVVSVIPGFFQLRLAENPGAAFSLFAGTTGLARLFFLILLPLGVVLFILYYGLKREHQTVTYVGFGLVLGGALGNLYDRVFSGKVVDFFDLYLGSYHYPTFNVADVAVLLGLLLLLLRRS